VIVIDTSAIVSIFRSEDDAEDIAACLVDADRVSISAATLLEASIVMSSDRLGSPTINNHWLDAFVASSRIEVEPVTLEQIEIARRAFRQYGKGTGHGAGLNFGDCFAYALAKSLDAPLLFKGNDFSRTDIVPALRV
jgi:ribonuclease VapC